MSTHNAKYQTLIRFCLIRHKEGKLLGHGLCSPKWPHYRIGLCKAQRTWAESNHLFVRWQKQQLRLVVLEKVKDWLFFHSSPESPMRLCVFKIFIIQCFDTGKSGTGMPGVVRVTRVDTYKDRSYCTSAQGHFSINKKVSKYDSHSHLAQ